MALDIAHGRFVLGFTRRELTAIARFLVIGVVMVYATIMTLPDAVHRALTAAQNARTARAERRRRPRSKQRSTLLGLPRKS